MTYLERFRKSRTVRMSFYKQLGGVLSIIVSNIGYFENSVPVSVIGAIITIDGIYQYFLRVDTNTDIK